MALLQISPEFFVEWATVKKAAFDPAFLHNAMANLYGANKLLVGFGPPLVFFVYYFFSPTKKENYIKFHAIKSYSVFVMIFGIAYNFIIYLKNSLMWYDSIVLIAIYFGSVFFIGRMELHYSKLKPSAQEDGPELEDSAVEKLIHKFVIVGEKVNAYRAYIASFIFLATGGALLVGFAEEFLECLLHAATAAGVSTFIFIGYVAPFMSEFPEKLVAIGYAMKGHADTAMVNFLSSILAQLTLLTAMVPLAYSYYKGTPTGIVFDAVQSQELLLVIAMMLYSLMLFLDLKFTIRETIMALGLFIWQFVMPESRDTVTKVYFVLFLSYFLEMVLEKRHTDVIETVIKPKDICRD
ncbi:MAG: Sodium/calcium exchanger membrane region [uncultured bacterium]|nr:MAG: Sodium/calcium exchanger membrane region [uncultured bacterium]